MQTDTQRLQAAPSANGVPPDAATRSSDRSEMDDFIYLISHDVRASVRALLELPQWIEEDLQEAGISTGGSVGSSIELMNRHAGRLDRMLVDLLAYSRVGRMQTAQALEIEDVLEDVLDQVNVPARFKVTRQLDQRTLTMGDRDLSLLLSALISNACKHHDRDEGRIHIACEVSGDRSVIRVSDDGPGIDDAYAERVFAPMTTLRPRDEVEGSGMGLAQVQKIARFYGGGVRIVPSCFDRGTGIEAQLPT